MDLKQHNNIPLDLKYEYERDSKQYMCRYTDACTSHNHVSAYVQVWWGWLCKA